MAWQDYHFIGHGQDFIFNRILHILPGTSGKISAPYSSKKKGVSGKEEAIT
jgi:hypothetical protein